EGCPSLSGMTVETAQDAPSVDIAPSVDTVPPVATVSPVDIEQVPRLPSLSPSRAADFKTCPLLFRFRTIDRLPEQPSADQARGTLVHAVLEHLFDREAAERTEEVA